MAQIVTVRVRQMGWHGDRAGKSTPYYNYKIHLVDEGSAPSSENLIETIDGYDHYWSAHRPEAEVLAEANERAAHYAKIFKHKLEKDIRQQDEAEIRKRALAKLTQEEREILGL